MWKDAIGYFVMFLIGTLCFAAAFSYRKKNHERGEAWFGGGGGGNTVIEAIFVLIMGIFPWWMTNVLFFIAGIGCYAFIVFIIFMD